MIYGDFIEKTKKYLKSVRILKNYVSFDMTFPNTWNTIKKIPEGIEIVQSENNEGITVTSFVCENERALINIIENTIEMIVKTNLEREEKEKLFKNKVQELKHIFEKENLENLKSLKFDIEELTKILENEESNTTEEVTK